LKGSRVNGREFSVCLFGCVIVSDVMVPGACEVLRPVLDVPYTGPTCPPMCALLCNVSWCSCCHADATRCKEWLAVGVGHRLLGTVFMSMQHLARDEAFIQCR